MSENNLSHNDLIVSKEKNNNLFNRAIKNFQNVICLSNKGFKGIAIKIKRRNIIREYERYMNIAKYTNANKREIIEKKYNVAYDTYLKALNTYITDNIYQKVLENKGSYDENKLIQEYLQIVELKDIDYMEYKYKRQKFLLNRDIYNVLPMENLYLLEMYKRFYVEKMDEIYKTIIKTYSIRLVQNSNDAEIYDSIYNEIEEYITDIIPYKIQLDFEHKKEYNSIIQASKELEKYKYEANNTNKIKYIEKNMLLLSISREIFVHSLPLIAAEQCYIKLLKETRNIIVKPRDFNQQNDAYDLLIKLIESYNIQLLSKKVYWESSSTREEYNKFWKEYQRILKLENIDFEEYKRQRDSLFIYYDLKLLNRVKTNKYEDIKNFYRRKLKELKGLRKLKDKYILLKGKYIKI